MGTRRIGGWWRLWIVLSAAWFVLMVCVGLINMRWPKVDDLRLERTSAACTITQDNQQIVMNRIYSEDKLRETAKNLKFAGEQWWPGLQRCVRSLDADYSAVRRTEAVQSFVPMILITLLPPLGMLVVGAALAWIARGFRKS